MQWNTSTKPVIRLPIASKARAVYLAKGYREFETWWKRRVNDNNVCARGHQLEAEIRDELLNIEYTLADTFLTVPWRVVWIVSDIVLQTPRERHSILTSCISSSLVATSH